MRFFIPPHSDKIDDSDADTILKGLFHTIASLSDTDSKKQALLEYLLAVGSAVPLPKALVANPLKEKLNEASLKALVTSFGSNIRSMTGPRQIITAVINTWIWANHNKLFEKTFAKRGRIDVDPHCKWIIHAAIEVATRSLVGKNLKVNRLSIPKGSNQVYHNQIKLIYK